MLDEHTALLRNDTRDLAPPDLSPNMVGNKWVYYLTCKLDGSIERFKAWLVAKGFHQRLDIDFHELSAPWLNLRLFVWFSLLLPETLGFMPT